MKVLEVQQGVPFQEFNVRLSDVTYIFKLQWNFRREVWGLMLFDADRTLLHAINGLPLGSMPNALRAYDEETPRGIIKVIDTTGQDSEPSLNSLGGIHQLVYISKAEYTALPLAE